MTTEVKHKKPAKNKTLRRILLIAVILAAGIFAFIKIREARRYESTDDAQLETDISPVSPRTSGYIAQVRFSDNEQVHEGDTLVIIDDRDLRIKVEMAQSALQNAEASLETARANASASGSEKNISGYKTEELQVQLDQARADYARYKKLLDEGSATEQQYEKAKTAMETLEKQIQTAEQMQNEAGSKTHAASTQVEVAESVVQQRQADLDFAKLQLSYAYVLAPFDGIVSKKNAVIGQLVQAGQPLCSIIREDNLWVVANFKETQIRKIDTGMLVYVHVDAFSGRDITGRVSSFSSATGAKFSLIPPDNATGNYVKVVQRIPVKIDLNDTDDQLRGLIAGMSVSVKVDLRTGSTQ